MSMRLVISHSFHIIWTCGIIVNAVVNIVTNQDNTSYYECSNLEETSGALYPSGTFQFLSSCYFKSWGDLLHTLHQMNV